MQTIVYLIRHSLKIGKDDIDRTLSEESKQLLNEKTPLSIEGERRAKVLSELDEFADVDAIYSSNYTRTIQTAKYMATKRNIKIIVDDRFNERKHGIFDGEINLEKYYQDDFKNPEGESPKEVRKRMIEALENTINNNKGKKIVIFSHGAAMTMLLMKWCKLEKIDNNAKKTISYNGEILIDKTFGQPEIFKLIFDENNDIIDISNIRMEW